MIQKRLIVFIVGVFLTILATAMGIPALMDLLHQDPDWVYFGQSAAITGFVGVLLMLAFRPGSETPRLDVRDTFILTAAIWITTSVFASLPFLLSSAAPSFPKLR